MNTCRVSPRAYAAGCAVELPFLSRRSARRGKEISDDRLVNCCRLGCNSGIISLFMGIREANEGLVLVKQEEDEGSEIPNPIITF